MLSFVNSLLEWGICESLTVAGPGIARRSNEEIGHCDVAGGIARSSCVSYEAHNIPIRICSVELESVAGGKAGGNATVYREV